VITLRQYASLRGIVKACLIILIRLHSYGLLWKDCKSTVIVYTLGMVFSFLFSSNHSVEPSPTRRGASLRASFYFPFRALFLRSDHRDYLSLRQGDDGRGGGAGPRPCVRDHDALPVSSSCPRSMSRRFRRCWAVTFPCKQCSRAAREREVDNSIQCCC
jgi:hypothetical protein